MKKIIQENAFKILFVFFFVISIILGGLLIYPIFNKSEDKPCKTCEVCEICNDNSDIENEPALEENEWLHGDEFLMAYSIKSDQTNPTETFDDTERIAISCMYALNIDSAPFVTRDVDQIFHEKYLPKTYVNNISIKLFDQQINDNNVDGDYKYDNDEYACNIPTGFGEYKPVIEKLYFDSQNNIYTLKFKADNNEYELKYTPKDNRNILLSLKKIK